MGTPELIADFSIFSDFSRNNLLEIAQYLEVLEFNADDTVFREKEKADKFYVVLSGEVELRLIASDQILKADVHFEDYTRTKTEIVEREIAVDSIEPGEIFGWSALTPAGNFTSKAVCVEPTKVFAFPAGTLRNFFIQHPEVGYPFMERLAEIISNRLTNRTNKLIEGWSEAFNVNHI